MSRSRLRYIWWKCTLLARIFARRFAFGRRRRDILLNPYYLVRRGLYKSIRLCAECAGPVDKVVDVGCGSKPYRHLISCNTYIGLDVDFSSHSHDLEKPDVWFDGHRLPLKSKYIDLVVLFEVLEHVDQPINLISEIWRCLSDDGTLILSVPFLWNEHEVPYDFRRYTITGIESFLERNGFIVQRSFRTTTSFETLMQLWMAYLIEDVFGSNIVFKFLLSFLFGLPVVFVARILARFGLAGDSMYCNSVLIVKKVEPVN